MLETVAKNILFTPFYMLTVIFTVVVITPIWILRNVLDLIFGERNTNEYD